jgi:hypothetical protein
MPNPARLEAAWHPEYLRLCWKCLDIEIDAYDVASAISRAAACALAEFSQPEVTDVAQVETRGDEYAVDVFAILAFELENHVNGTVVACAAAQNPAAAAQNCSGEDLHETAWFDVSGCPELQSPRISLLSSRDSRCVHIAHGGFIGRAESSVTGVSGWNDELTRFQTRFSDLSDDAEPGANSTAWPPKLREGEFQDGRE